MIDFLMISTKSIKKDVIEIYPKFIIKKSSDLMIRGGDFYAIWIEELGLWSTEEQDALQLIDREIDNYVNENRQRFASDIKIVIRHMWDAESGMVDRWHKYCQKQMRDSFHMLDEKLIFSNMQTTKKDYASKKLPYPLEKGETPAYEKLMSTLYVPEEREKIEWAVGSIVSGDSKQLQKFMVLYGAAGTGKSTVLNIIQKLFEGYYSVFDAKALGSSNNAFALEAFKTNPLVAIQHDGDLSRIEDNTRLNSLVSHELMTVNEKFRSAYSNRFKCFLFMGTNKPVKITDAKSGLIRRLIDVSPSGNKLPGKEYKFIMKQIDFELGGIAYHCKEVYESNPGKYDNYIPVAMLGASNDFYNFIMDSYVLLEKEDGISLKSAWDMYKNYCEDAKISYPFSKRIFKEELKNYFQDYKDRYVLENGSRVRNYYIGFLTEKFEDKVKDLSETATSWIRLADQDSLFDEYFSECPAQLASKKETPLLPWDKVTTKLSDVNTKELHYVRIPKNVIVVDFDIPGESGNKSLEKNLQEANKWPKTYAELSKSGSGIHLHYIYSGDVNQLAHLYAEHIEIKTFTGKSSLRRKLIQCNDIPIASISSGLPTKGEKKVVNFEAVQSERGLRNLIKKNLAKEIHPNTKPSIDFIYKILEDAHNSGLKYDVSDMRSSILSFAASSTNQAKECIKLVGKMKFQSEEPSENIENEEAKLVFYDLEVFPNLLLINWKTEGEDKPIVRMINPPPKDIEQLMCYRLVGFNCRRYDNHILYARYIGKSVEEIFQLSQKIINSKKGEQNQYFFREAYNISYTDIYDFASAQNKKSLKKLEIEMGIHHQELGLPWDQPVPESLWPKVSEYCDNDVRATEAAFYYLKADWTARQILSDLAGMSVNDTTNTLTQRIIFGNNKNPQTEFHYRDLSKPVLELDDDVLNFLKEACPEMMQTRHGEANSLLPYFPGYKYDSGVSMYRDQEVGEGGYVFAEPGMYGNVALLDISSMHPHSTIAECLFGIRYTKAYRDIVEGRVSIKHESWEEVNHMLDGKLTPYIQKVLNGEITSDDLANALKTAINAVYGQTAASYQNPFRDPRNRDNIVAKRGSLFMVDLLFAVREQGFQVAHIKTDSIKIPDATPEIIQFVMDFGKKYGYSFEHEATYDRMCLVNNAVYIAKYKNADDCQQMYGYIPGKNKKKSGEWTATGKQFAVPYVYKTLFTHEPITIDDMRETFEVRTALYLDLNEKLPDVSEKEKELEKLETKYKKGLISDTLFEPESLRLNEEIAKGHDYRFVGKVGEFCPVLPGKGGGILCREQNGKYYAATGTIGYRWLESEYLLKPTSKKKTILDEKTGEQREIVQTEGIPENEKIIDRSFYQKLVDDAIDSISEYGDYEWFVSEDPYVKRPKMEDFTNIPEGDEEELPFN